MGKGANINVHIGAETKELQMKLAKAQTSLKGFKSTALKMAGGLGVIFGGQMLLSGISSAVSKIADFEEQMDKVAAVSRATAKEVKALKDNALDLGASTRFTATEIGQMQEVMARLGKTTSEIIGATKAVSMLSIATATELAPAAELMTKTMNAFNLQASDSARVANILSEATSHTALNMEDLGVGLSYAGSSGRAFGWELEKVTAALGVLQDNGIDASKAGAGLRAIFIELAKSGMTYDDAMNEIFASTNRLKKAEELFSKTSANQALILAENQVKLQDLTDTFSDANIEMDEMVRIMEDNLNNDLKLLGSAWDGLIQKGSVLNNTGRGFVGWLTDALNVISGNTPAHKSMDLLTEAAKHFGVELTALQKTDFRTGLGEGSKFGRGLVAKYLEALKVAKALDEFEKSMAADSKAADEEEARAKAAAALEQSVKKGFTPDKVEGIKLYTDEMVRLEKITTGTTIKQDELSLALVTSQNSTVPASEAFAKLKEQVKGVKIETENLVKGLHKVGEISVEIGGLIAQNITSSIVDMSTAMGNGMNSIGEFGAMLLKSIGEFLVSLGEALVAAGVATVVAETELFTNPWAAIAAGAALVGIGAALGAAQKNAMKDLESGSNVGSSSMRNDTMIGLEASRQEILVSGRIVAEGSQLVTIIENQNKRSNSTGGRIIGG